MKKILTLCLIYKDNQVLLGMKKRGFGMGKWNGFGGKVNSGESIEDGAKRELFEEANITADSMKEVGLLNFTWQSALDVTWEVHVFSANNFEGDLQETEEMKPQWFDANNIPFESMWADDKFWFPLFFAGKKFTGTFLLDGKNQIVNHKLQEL